MRKPKDRVLEELTDEGWTLFDEASLLREEEGEYTVTLRVRKLTPSKRKRAK